MPDFGPIEPSTLGFGHVPPPILHPGAQQVTVDELRSSGFDLQLFATPDPLQALIVNDRAQPTGAYEYYGPTPVDADTTLADLMDAGGVFVIQHLTQGRDAARIKSELGDKAFIIDLGPYQAALVWGEGFLAGSRRPYAVYWSDRTFDWSVIAGTSTPAEAVAIARSNYCG